MTYIPHGMDPDLAHPQKLGLKNPQFLPSSSLATKYELAFLFCWKCDTPFKVLTFAWQGGNYWVNILLCLLMKFLVLFALFTIRASIIFFFHTFILYMCVCGEMYMHGTGVHSDGTQHLLHNDGLVQGRRIKRVKLLLWLTIIWFLGFLWYQALQHFKPLATHENCCLD